MKRTSSKSTKLKCGCDRMDVNEFCELCCPEEYECLKWPHIQEYIKKQLQGAKPTKYQIGDKVWILGDHKIEQKTIYGVCLEKDYKNGKDITLTKYELSLENRYSQSSRFFYTEKLLFPTREALIDDLCNPKKD